MSNFERFLRILRSGYEEGESGFINSDDADLLDHPSPPAAQPSEEGIELLGSGEFGRIGVKHRARQGNPNIVRTILKQRSCTIPVHSREDIHSVSIGSHQMLHC